MKRLFASVLLSCGCAGLTLANLPAVPSNAPAAVEAVKQVERALGDAIVAADTDKLNQILADDWQTIGSSGVVYTKESILRDLKLGKNKLEWLALGPMNVQVAGDVAVGLSCVMERRSRDGMDTSGNFVWMDLLEKRGGKWVFVRSTGVKVSEGSTIRRTFGLI
ncbi:MAG TPA: nuclear transport factor 2 family protein [Steroidobacteraceae bacterium]|nr:nuclear transport factor 2 family protein [Steroidobacteraceae bacterium]